MSLLTKAWSSWWRRSTLLQWSPISAMSPSRRAAPSSNLLEAGSLKVTQPVAVFLRCGHDYFVYFIFIFIPCLGQVLWCSSKRNLALQLIPYMECAPGLIFFVVTLCIQVLGNWRFVQITDSQLYPFIVRLEGSHGAVLPKPFTIEDGEFNISAVLSVKAIS